MVALLVLLALLMRWVFGLLDDTVPSVLPPDEQCVVRVGEVSDELSLEQSRNAAIIVAEAQRRGLPARASSIALATAMQESSLRNIDYGDRDSVGLFQQRPSQGWGTVEQIMDPWYSAGKFYDHLVEVDGWQSGDLNDVAQKVQRSGVPDGYRKHIEAAKAWGSALTGHSPAAVSCINRGTQASGAADGTKMLARAFGKRVSVTTGQAVVTLDAPQATDLWSATQLFMMTTGSSGVVRVDVGQQNWTNQGDALASWQGTPSPSSTETVITLRA